MTDHHVTARELGIPHGQAVVLARSFCPSGHGTGAHGSTCPCDDCTMIAVIALADLRDRGRISFSVIERFIAAPPWGTDTPAFAAEEGNTP